MLRDGYNVSCMALIISAPCPGDRRSATNKLRPFSFYSALIPVIPAVQFKMRLSCQRHQSVTVYVRLLLVPSPAHLISASSDRVPSRVTMHYSWRRSDKSWCVLRYAPGLLSHIDHTLQHQIHHCLSQGLSLTEPSVNLVALSSVHVQASIFCCKRS